MKTKKTQEITYDKATPYQNEIAPLLSQLTHICLKHKIPCLCAFAIENSRHGLATAGIACTGPDGYVPDSFRLAAALLRGKAKVPAVTDWKHLLQDMIASAAEREFTGNQKN